MRGIIILLLSISLLFTSCKNESSQVTKKDTASIPSTTSNSGDILSPPDWVSDATIYEVNLRQYTEEGTFKSFIPQIPRLKDIGIDVLWFMPIYPISEAKRKGGLGSYYAVSDYTAVNEAEHGSLQDFKEMVAAIHRSDMKIILDYVPNHTGWDHEWITKHPEYYTQNAKGEIIDPIDPGTGESWGWTDVADLNFDNKEMRAAMIEEMKWWLTECDIDGFRMDVAHGVPYDFWDECIPALMKTKKVFMLAEAEKEHLRNTSGFAADYGWAFHHLMNEIAEGKKNAADINTWYQEYREKYTKGFHIHFTSNHDENSWNGTEFERMAEGHKAFAVLASTFDGMPLVYSGQEEPLRRRLKFFEKDVIGFKNYQYADFYRTLLSLKKQNKALKNDMNASKTTIWETASPNVIAYSRQGMGDALFTIINLSPIQQSVEFAIEGWEGPYENIFGNSTISLGPNAKFNLKPWDYLVLSRAQSN